MNLKDMLDGAGIDLHHVLVLRNRPSEPRLNKALPQLATERPELFTAYQQAHGGKLEGAMKALEGKGYIASFIGKKPGEATFVALYSIKSSEPLTYEQYWKVPANKELEKRGMSHWVTKVAPRPVQWFNLVECDFYRHWRGKLIVRWPPPERSWWRRAHSNEFPIHAVLEESELDVVMDKWYAIELKWEELRDLPKSWKNALSQWRGIYYIFDTFDGKGYVGSASGEDNLLGRWLHYAARGHGGNQLLLKRDPRQFLFTILERVSPDMDTSDVIRRESTWKQRLHTRVPHGLNEN